MNKKKQMIDLLSDALSHLSCIVSDISKALSIAAEDYADEVEKCYDPLDFDHAPDSERGKDDRDVF